MVELLRELEVYQHLMAVALGMPRLLILCLVAPFFGPAVVSGQIRSALVISLYLMLHPLVQAEAPPAPPASLAEALLLMLLLTKETLLGFILGWLGAVPFWAAQCGGFFIDNQRGASMAEGQEALTGEETSPLGVLFLQAIIYIFFVSGGFLAFMSLVYTSYVVWPVTSLVPALGHKVAVLFAHEADWIMTHMLLLAGPIVVACLLIDLSLGLMNRFASQLNVYILAMPIKSGVAALILLVYVGKLSSNTPAMYQHVHTIVRRIQGMLT